MSIYNIYMYIYIYVYIYKYTYIYTYIYKNIEICNCSQFVTTCSSSFTAPLEKVHSSIFNQSSTDLFISLPKGRRKCYKHFKNYPPNRK